MRSVGVSASTSAQRVELHLLDSALAIARDRLLDGAEQHVGVDRLGQEILCARLHGQTLDGMSPCPERNDDRQRMPHFGQPLLELQAAEPRHAEVEQNAAGGFDIGRFQELSRRFVLPHRVSGRTHNRAADVRQDASSSTTCTMGVGRHERFVEANGSVNRNTVPPAAAFSARIWPPCASMIVRDIASPSPMPVVFEVTKGLEDAGTQLFGDAATGIGHGVLRRTCRPRAGCGSSAPFCPSACSALPRSR